jgi:hypothetical protein
VVSVEALAFAREYMGEPGPYVRRIAPEILAATHSHYVALQTQSRLKGADPYGLIWLGLPMALLDALKDVAGIQVFHPKRARYSIPLVNNVPVIGWRYGRDARTDPKEVPFGRPVSGARRNMFTPPELQPELPLGRVGLGDEIIQSLDTHEREQLDHFSVVASFLAQAGSAAVLAYASNPDAILKAFFGYATLDDNMLRWIFLEPLDMLAVGSGMLRDLDDERARPAFDSGPLVEPEMRLRPHTRRGTGGTAESSDDATGSSDGDTPPAGSTDGHE